MDNNASMNWSADYGNCPGCGGQPPAITEGVPQSAAGGVTGNPHVPTLEEIAGYNYMNPYQQERQRQLLEGAGNAGPGATPLQNRYLPSRAALRGGAAVPANPPAMNYPVSGSAAVPPFAMTPQAVSPSVMNPSAPITPTTEPPPLNVESLQYMNGFLRTQIGRPVRVEFLIGTNNLVDRSGILLAVGANYILLNETETDDILLCDFYNIKFIRFYY